MAGTKRVTWIKAHGTAPGGGEVLLLSESFGGLDENLIRRLEIGPNLNKATLCGNP